jgi:hypothetical protein
MKNETKTICPNCGYEIDVNSIIYQQLEEELTKKYNSMLAAEKKKFETEYEQFEYQKKQFALEKEKQDTLIKEQVGSKLKTEKEKLTVEIKSKIYEEQSEQIAEIQKELNEKNEKIKELYLVTTENAKLKREIDGLKEATEAEFQKKFNQQLTDEREKVRKSEQEKNEFVIKELQKQLEDQKKLTEEMKRKQEQGSMQLQGEVQELAIEEWLANNFPLDTISEIKKGDRGADCIQIIHTRMKQNCGSIYYESKRTKEFKFAWLEKFKDDIREKGANIGVLVTDVFPKGTERMNLIEGIWVCSFEEFKGLCVVLRESIIQLNNLASSQENKGDKMIMLYDFLTSNEFRSQVEGIVEGFTQMQADLIAEKRAIQGHWKKREKQIQKVILNTNYMYNSIKGIAGNAIQSIKNLELSTSTVDELNFEEE